MTNKTPMLEARAREAAFVAFAMRCSAQNPAAIGPARNEAVGLLERFGIEPRDCGLFYHDIAADERDAAAMLAFATPEIPEEVRVMVERLRELLAKATPGPWGFDLRYEGGPCHIWAPVERHTIVDGYLALRSGKEDLADLRKQNAEANAALIVEAINALPDLLTLLSGEQSGTPASIQAQGGAG